MSASSQIHVACGAPTKKGGACRIVLNSKGVCLSHGFQRTLNQETLPFPNVERPVTPKARKSRTRRLLLVAASVAVIGAGIWGFAGRGDDYTSATSLPEPQPQASIPGACGAWIESGGMRVRECENGWESAPERPLTVAERCASRLDPYSDTFCDTVAERQKDVDCLFRYSYECYVRDLPPALPYELRPDETPSFLLPKYVDRAQGRDWNQPHPYVEEEPDHEDLSGCTPGYAPCLPPAQDYDCRAGSGNGPAYTGRVYVTGPDIYGLDRDGDGVGCE